MMTDERWNQLRACHNQWAWDCAEQGEMIAEMDRLRAENAALRDKVATYEDRSSERERERQGRLLVELTENLQMARKEIENGTVYKNLRAEIDRLDSANAALKSRLAEAERLLNCMRHLLGYILLSADQSWEDHDQGHDWADCCRMIREHKKEIREFLHPPTADRRRRDDVSRREMIDGVEIGGLCTACGKSPYSHALVMRMKVREKVDTEVPANCQHCGAAITVRKGYYMQFYLNHKSIPTAEGGD